MQLVHEPRELRRGLPRARRMRRIVAEEPPENARRLRVAPPAACSVSMWKNTASPGSSSHARISNPLRFDLDVG